MCPILSYQNIATLTPVYIITRYISITFNLMSNHIELFNFLPSVAMSYMYNSDAILLTVLE